MATPAFQFHTKATIATFGGTLLKLTHESAVLGCPMALNVFFPPAAFGRSTPKVPVLWYLAGLTCSSDNGAEKGFFNYWAAKYGIAVVYPDTSPRGSNHPGEHDAYDFGSAAGFYLDATKEPWSQNYKMETYITSELPAALYSYFIVLDNSRVSLMGHSMGGHGALTLFFKHPGKYKSTSAFAPIVNPSKCPWGEKAFSGYLASKKEWAKHDATELIKAYSGADLDIFISCGLSDEFLIGGQLLIDNFVAAAKEAGRESQVTVKYAPGYDHSYYYVSTLAQEHVEHAAKHLGVL
ncbi:Alpha/Beta hydrolase protein [Lipomyces chichibuensis]|uniref:Alpha/Beta hydrolase protein n=1 Tax=Lipomyces chichibuensis TaxID=1546026 RepID=UPI0033441B35